MSILLRIWAIFTVTLKRLVSNRWLALATLFGLVITVGLTMSVPLYTDSTYYRIFEETIAGDPKKPWLKTNRPPFALLYRYVGSFDGPIEWEKAQPADNFFTQQAGRNFGLPVTLSVRHFATDNFRIFPLGQDAYKDINTPLAWEKFGFLSDYEKYITLVEGTFPKDAAPSADSVMDVLISEAVASKIGIQAGEDYMAYGINRPSTGGAPPQFQIHVSGVWKAINPKDPYWFYNPTMLEDLMLVTEPTFRDRISPYVEKEVALAAWYFVLDGSQFSISDASRLVGKVLGVKSRGNALLSGVRLDVSPVDDLLKYQQSIKLLNIFLFAFSIPFLGLVLAFISLVSGLSVQVRRNEIAMIRSRGVTWVQMIGNAIFEGIVLGTLAVLIAIPVSRWLASYIGQTVSFLTVANLGKLHIQLTASTVYLGLLVVGIALLMQLVPTLDAARFTIVTYKQDRARSMQKPWWQRYYLDIMLLVPTLYGAYLLRKQGAVAVVNTGVNTNPMDNPLLFLVPLLGIIAASLVFLRFLPPLMSIIAWISSHTKSTGLLLAARHLSRSPSFYITPLLLLMMTISLAAFSASMAETLDSNLHDRVYFKNGADLALVEFGQSTTLPTGFGPGGGTQASNQGATTAPEDTGPRWLFLPVSEHLRVKGVQKATRVGYYRGTINISDTTADVSLMGIDRDTFADVAYWRRDFARESLGGLMNNLALTYNGVLVPRSFLAKYALAIGDSVPLTIVMEDVQIQTKVKILNTFDLFPTWYPQADQPPVIVGNLEFIFREMGGQFPYDVWLRTSQYADPAKISTDLESLGFNIYDLSDARSVIGDEQKQPNRQGLFGMLSVGFIASAVLTVLSFMLYALFSFRRRFIEFGVLQAIGLSPFQMATLLSSELMFLILLGVGVGTALGVEVSSFFIPYLQVGGDISSLYPPFQVLIAWPSIFRIYGMIVALFLTALSVLLVLLLRMKVFQAIKLGETL